MKKTGKDSLLDAIRSALLIGVLGWVINIILAYILDILVLSAALPQFSEIFPSLESALKTTSLDDQASERLSNIIFSSCMLAFCIPSFAISYRLHKGRKEKFLSETKGLIPRKEGLIYHLKNHWLSESAIFICNLLISLWAGVFSSFGLFQLLFGKLFSLPLTVIIILFTQLSGILLSQSHWRAAHFIGEE